MTVLNGLTSAIAGQVEDILLRQGRSIGTLIPGVVVEEQHEDELTITSHPVAVGANISDHAVKEPANLIMRCGWSTSGTIFNIGADLQLSPNPQDAYATLQAMQNSRQPINVVTGKRSYQNMLIRRLTVITDIESENALMAEVELHEVIIANTTLTTTPTVTNPDQVTVTPFTSDNTALQQPIDVGAKQPGVVTNAITDDENDYIIQTLQ